MRADATAPREALPRELDEDDARVVLDALGGGADTRFDVLAERAGPEALADLAASEHGAQWAGVPRHAVPRSARLAVLHAAARLFRFDGSAPHLGGDLAQSLVACLRDGDLEWAELAARYWRQWTMHAGEARSSWPQAERMLARFTPAIESRPGLLGSVAALAAAAAAPEADEMWERTLAHPLLADSAQRRWELELEWARCHLLLGGGRPARAITVLRRVQGGLGDLGSSAGRLAWTDATLELVCALAWTGDGSAAVEVFDAALRRVEPGGELEAWLRGAGAYACAVAGDVTRADREALAVEAALTDTGSLALRALVPARLICAARRDDRAALRAAVDDARTLEVAQATDLDAVACWRLHGAEAAAILAEPSLARTLLAGLDEALADAPGSLPVHQLRRDHLACRLGLGDHGDLAGRAKELGVELPDLPRLRDADSGRVEVSLFGAFAISHDGSPVPGSAWGGRRQARLLLALLLTRGGRVERDDAAEVLWGALDGQTAAARINPLLNSIRSVLSITGDGVRALGSRGGSIVLELADVDATDLARAQAAVAAVERDDPDARTVALAALEALRERPIDDLGADAAAVAIRQELDELAHDLVPRLAAAWDGVPAPDRVLEAVRASFAEDPADASTCAALLRILRDRNDVPGASAAYHETSRALRDELGLAPPLDLVRLHGAIIAAGDGADPGSVASSGR